MGGDAARDPHLTALATTRFDVSDGLRVDVDGVGQRADRELGVEPQLAQLAAVDPAVVAIVLLGLARSPTTALPTRCHAHNIL